MKHIGMAAEWHDPDGPVHLSAIDDCPLCGAHAVAELPPYLKAKQPDDTTHVCVPSLGGCNHGFAKE